MRLQVGYGRHHHHRHGCAVHEQIFIKSPKLPRVRANERAPTSAHARRVQTRRKGCVHRPSLPPAGVSTTSPTKPQCSDLHVGARREHRRRGRVMDRRGGRRGRAAAAAAAAADSDATAARLPRQ